VTWLMLLSQNCLDGYVENQNFSQDSRWTDQGTNCRAQDALLRMRPMQACLCPPEACAYHYALPYTIATRCCHVVWRVLSWAYNNHTSFTAPSFSFMTLQRSIAQSLVQVWRAP
jgi:hypothetical protein